MCGVLGLEVLRNIATGLKHAQIDRLQRFLDQMNVSIPVPGSSHRNIPHTQKKR